MTKCRVDSYLYTYGVVFKNVVIIIEEFMWFLSVPHEKSVSDGGAGTEWHHDSWCQGSVNY